MGDHILWVALEAGLVAGVPREGRHGNGAVGAWRLSGGEAGAPSLKVSVNCRGGKVQLKAVLMATRWWGLPTAGQLASNES